MTPQRWLLLCLLVLPALTACSDMTNPFAPEESAAVPSDLSAESYRCLRAYGNLLGGSDVANTLLERLRGTALREGITVEEALKRELQSAGVEAPRACSHLR